MMEIVVNAICTGIGAGFGSYFGSKMAQRTEHHFKNMVGLKEKEK